MPIDPDDRERPAFSFWNQPTLGAGVVGLRRRVDEIALLEVAGDEVLVEASLEGGFQLFLGPILGGQFRLITGFELRVCRQLIGRRRILRGRLGRGRLGRGRFGRLLAAAEQAAEETWLLVLGHEAFSALSVWVRPRGR